jgi:hypothetical protein
VKKVFLLARVLVIWNTTGLNNTFIGFASGFGNTTGTSNSLLGYKSGYALSTGSNNSFVGSQAGLNNTTGSYNTFTGAGAGTSVNTGYSNTATGFNAMVAGTTGTSNCIFGTNAAVSQTTATDNSAFGYGALYNGTGSYNTALGSNAGGLYSTGNNNTFIGNSADAGAIISNSTALGNTAIVNASNKIRLGNTTVSVIEGQVAWSWPSDARFKTNVTENVKGLEFIKNLRPVNYQFNTEEFDLFLMKNMPDSVKTKRTQGIDYTASKAVIHTGFIAQEVEQAAITSGYVFDGVHVPVNDDDNYSVSYAQFVVPLVKAVQELSKISDSLQTRTNDQDSVNNFLQNQINQLTNMINDCCSSSDRRGTNNEENNNNANSTNVILNESKAVVLNQNTPNPFAEQTTITYFLPENTGKAQILFYNSGGQLIQSVEITTKGHGTLNVFADDLSHGIYTYSIVIEGKIIETKKMIKQ